MAEPDSAVLTWSDDIVRDILLNLLLPKCPLEVRADVRAVCKNWAAWCHYPEVTVKDTNPLIERFPWEWERFCTALGRADKLIIPNGGKTWWIHRVPAHSFCHLTRLVWHAFPWDECIPLSLLPTVQHISYNQCYESPVGYNELVPERQHYHDERILMHIQGLTRPVMILAEPQKQFSYLASIEIINVNRCDAVVAALVDTARLLHLQKVSLVRCTMSPLALALLLRDCAASFLDISHTTLAGGILKNRHAHHTSNHFAMLSHNTRLRHLAMNHCVFPDLEDYGWIARTPSLVSLAAKECAFDSEECMLALLASTSLKSLDVGDAWSIWESVPNRLFTNLTHNNTLTRLDLTTPIPFTAVCMIARKNTTLRELRVDTVIPPAAPDEHDIAARNVYTATTDIMGNITLDILHLGFVQPLSVAHNSTIEEQWRLLAQFLIWGQLVRHPHLTSLVLAPWSFEYVYFPLLHQANTRRLLQLTFCDRIRPIVPNITIDFTALQEESQHHRRQFPSSPEPTHTIRVEYPHNIYYYWHVAPLSADESTTYDDLVSAVNCIHSTSASDSAMQPQQSSIVLDDVPATSDERSSDDDMRLLYTPATYEEHDNHSTDDDIPQLYGNE